MICDEELSLFDLTDNSTVAFLEALISVSNAYGLIHKYVCLFICIFGSLANIVHIFVLTRPIMQKCAVNRLLSIIAVCDICTMTSYLLFVIRFGFAVDLANPPPGYALHWIVFLLGHVVCSIALHTITLYLSCATAYIRYKTLKKVGSKWNHKNAACPIFLSVATFVVLLCIPTFLIHSVVKVGATELVNTSSANQSLYTVGLAEFNTLDTCFIFKLNLWLTGIMFKVIPCILLMLFTVALLYELELNRKRRQLITSGTTPASRKNTAQSDRTTKVLIVLLIIFLCTEFPQGILAILNGLFPNDIHQFVYLSLGEILDLLSLINCNTCFIVYPLISTQYRETLRGILRCLAGCINPNGKYYQYHKKGGIKCEVSGCSSTGAGLGLNRVGRSSSRSRLLSPLCITNGNTVENTFNYSINNSSYNINHSYGNSVNGISPSMLTPSPTHHGHSMSSISPMICSGYSSPSKVAASPTTPMLSPVSKSASTVLLIEPTNTANTTSTSLGFLDDSDVLL